MDGETKMKRRVSRRVETLWGLEHRDWHRGQMSKLRWNVWSYADEHGMIRFQAPLPDGYGDFYLEIERIDLMSDAELLQEIEVQRAMILIAG